MTELERECFGMLDRVFPMGEKGLREVVDSCFECPDRVACLRAALETEKGLDLRGELLERSEPKGLAGRIKRWSERKDLHRRMKEKRGGGR